MRQNLDRYVARAILGSFGVALAFFLFLSILIDLLINLPRFVERAAKDDVDLVWFLARYYLQTLPLRFLSVAPFVTVIGCMFAVARLIATNELQPMLFVGRSMMRVLRPALLCGAFAAAGMAACWQWVVPRIGAQVKSMEEVLLGGSREIRNIVQELRGADRDVLLHAERFDPELGQLFGVQLLRVEPDPAANALIRADRAEWDARIGDWRLFRADPESGADGPGIVDTPRGQRPQEFLGAPDWPPLEIRRRAQDEVDCDLFAYDELIELRRLRPNRRDVAMALHRHVTYPLANLILLMLALPFAVHFERGSRIERVLGAIGVAFAYLMVDLTCQKLGLSGWVHPVVAAWSPTILFGSLGAVMYGSMRT